MADLQSPIQPKLFSYSVQGYMLKMKYMSSINKSKMASFASERRHLYIGL